MMMVFNSRILSYQSMTKRRGQISINLLEGEHKGSFAESISTFPIHTHDDDDDCDASSCSSSSLEDESQPFSIPTSTSAQDEQGCFPSSSSSSSSSSVMVGVNHSMTTLPVVFEEGEEEEEECEQDDDNDNIQSSNINSTQEEEDCLQHNSSTQSQETSELKDLTNTITPIPKKVESVNTNEQILCPSNNTVCSNTDATSQTAQDSISDGDDGGSVENYSTSRSIGTTETSNKRLQQLEEELDNRLNAILALKEVVFTQRMALKASKRDHERISKKLVHQTNLNKDLCKRNMDLERKLAKMKEQFRLVNVTKSEGAKQNDEKAKVSSRSSSKEREGTIYRINEDRKSEC